MLQLQALGTLDLRSADGHPVHSLLSQPKTMALLVTLLLLQPRGLQRRDRLCLLFWPESDDEHARSSLSQALHRIRRSLGEEAVVSRGTEEVGVAPGTIACDVVAFEDALAHGAHAEALALWRGPLLEAFHVHEARGFEEWLDAERSRLQELAARAARTLAQHHMERGDLLEAEAMVARALTLFPADEAMMRQLLTQLAAAGDRVGAARVCQGWVEQLRRELELEPPPEILRLAAELGRAAPAPAAVAAGAASPHGGATASARGTAATSDAAAPGAAVAPAGTAEAGARPAARRPTPAPRRAALPRSHAATAEQAGSGLPLAPDPTQSGSASDPEFLNRELGPDLEILGTVGEGRAARVYLARDLNLDRLVALKVLSGTLAGDPVALARFEREARAAASLEHPNAVAVHRFGVLSNQVPYLVMQYVPGGTLEARLEAEGPLPEAEARRILSEVAGALAEAHRHGFVHRDLRPGNVLCDDDRCRALVTDFGLAGLLPHARTGEERLTAVGELLSAVEYASPELLRGDELTAGSDIYALGILGYRIVAGAGPYEGRSGAALMKAHLTGRPRPLTALCPTVSSELAELLQRCLARDPAKRPRAGYVARLLATPSGEPPPGSGDTHAGHGSRLLGGILQRRLPQIVVVAAAAGWALQEFVGNQVDLGLLPTRAYGFAWATAICGVAAAGIIGWFHGPRGRQQVAAVEVGLLLVLAAVWIAAGVLILLH
jgi:DNA-binding SARP family transcriptional activator